MNPQELIADVFEYIRGMWRYRWWAAGIAWAISLAGWAYVYSMPDVYDASAKVYVDTNSLIKPLMKGLTATDNTLDEVQLVAKAVLTRPNLEKVAHDTDLDLRADTPEQLERLITGLQQRIKVSGGRDNIFTIQFQDVSRQKARDVVAAVLDTFVESAIGNDSDDADVTEEALASEIKDHEKRLSEAEARLGAFKKDNIGYMPNESGDYYAQLQTALAARDSAQEKLDQLTQRRDELKRQIDGEEPVFGIMSTPLGGTTAACSQSGQIAQLQNQVEQLTLDFTEKYPRIQSLNDTIDRLKAQCQEELEDSLDDDPVAASPASPATNSLESNPVYENLRIQLSNAEVDIAQTRAELQTREAQVAQLRRDVDKITDVETQLKQLNRDYDVVQARHQELLKRWEDLQAKKRLDPVTEQVQFRRIEPPFASAIPAGPNRPMLLVGVLVFAFGGGIAAVFGLNQLRPVFFTRRSLRQYSELPVLGSISLILGHEALRKRRFAAFAWGAVCLLLLVATALAGAFASQGAAMLRELTLGVGM